MAVIDGDPTIFSGDLALARRLIEYGDTLRAAVLLTSIAQRYQHATDKPWPTGYIDGSPRELSVALHAAARAALLGGRAEVLDMLGVIARDWPCRGAPSLRLVADTSKGSAL